MFGVNSVSTERAKGETASLTVSCDVQPRESDTHAQVVLKCVEGKCVVEVCCGFKLSGTGLAGTWRLSASPSSAQFKERAKLYLYSLSTPSW